MKGLKLRGIVGIFIAVLLCASVLVAHVYKQNTYVRLSIGAVKLSKVEDQLRNEIALLEVEVGSLKKRSRIEALAKDRYQLEYGNTPVLVYSERESGSESKELDVGKVAWRTKGF